jgi:lantibiotic modifying enzyme
LQSEALPVAAGVSLEWPYLNRDSSDDYAPLRVAPACAADAAPRLVPGSASIDLLSVAEQIGEQLCRQAVWHGERCTWLGPEPLLRAGAQPAFAWGWKPLGPDLYAGTGGVALFLGELYAATGNDAARDTALGAVRRALAALDAVPADARLGLYSGWPGIALVAARLGRLLRMPELCEAAAHVLRRCAAEARGGGEFDLMMGRAGAVVGFLIAAGALHDAEYLRIAGELGDELLDSTIGQRAGHAWRSPATPGKRPLTGFSHGAAGAGYALLELYRATGEHRFRLGAEQAFAYERALFDPR